MVVANVSENSKKIFDFQPGNIRFLYMATM